MTKNQPPIYREQLDNLPCGHCGGRQHGPMYLHPACHPKNGVHIKHENGLLAVNCAKCHRPIVEVKVKPAETIPTMAFCHSGAVNVRYENGKLSIGCKECDNDVVNPFAELDVESITD